VRDISITTGSCRVDSASGIPDVEVVTDADTYQQIDGGSLSGIEAFAQRRLVMRGSIEKSLYFEPLFERPAAGAMPYSLERIKAGRVRISTLSMGPAEAPPLVLLHGLGATKSSWLPVVPALARHYRVHAIDLPGFGRSSKPRARYDARWFSGHVFSLFDSLGIDSALVAGNSMGGRIAMEMGMAKPERVDAIACLCPAAAFSHRPALWLARLARPEFGFLASRLPRKRVKEGLRDLFARPSRVDESWFDAAVDDFLRIWKSPAARIAFFASLRHIYLEEPYGEVGFWTRLVQMNVPSLFFYGRKDPLITSHFAPKVAAALPRAKVITWSDCGHVPQIEFPDRTSDEMLGFFAYATRVLKAG
jgi:pimeloyl-ACP methyl ester carboxylesterase